MVTNTTDICDHRVAFAVKTKVDYKITLTHHNYRSKQVMKQTFQLR